MDTREPEIAFDERGFCNFCTHYYARDAREVPTGDDARRRLENLVAQVKGAGSGRDYDCVIGVSGGVDSTVVAYTVKQLGLRPLAVHLDNGWNAELAVDNIKNALEKLNIDLSTFVIDWEEFRDLQLSFLKASVQNIEIPTDHAITALLFHTAAKIGVRHIISGSNVRTEGIMPLEAGYPAQDLRHLLAIHKRFGTVPLRTMPLLSLKRLAYFVLAKGIRFVNILNYIDYDKHRSLELLQRELGYRPYGGKHYESVFTRFFQGYILPRKFGYDKRRAHFSCLVCSGELTRAQALDNLEAPPYTGWDLDTDKEFVIKKLGLNAESFEALMETPPKLFSEYPNCARLVVGMPRAKEFFKRIAKNG